jgi:hypothetical protein
MLLQAIVGAILKALEYFCIGTLHLPIALWMSNKCVANLDAKIFTVSFKGTASKLGPIVSNDPIWDPKSAYDGLDEFHCGLLVDFDHWGCFRPLGEFVDGGIEESVPSDGTRKWPHEVQPPHSKGSWGRDHLQRLRWRVDLLDMELACPAGLYQLNDILEGCMPVKFVPKGFTDQRAGRSLVPTLTPMDLYKQIAALFSGNEPH